MPVQRWTLYDPIDDETFILHFNPAEIDDPLGIEKNVTKSPTSAGDGRTLVFQGQHTVRDLSWTGHCRTEQQWLDLCAQAEKEHQLRLTDDLNRVMWIYITGLTARRRQKGQPGVVYRSYDLKFIRLDIP